MSLYKELSPFIEYVHSIRKLKNFLSLDLKFPTKWTLPKSIVDESQVVGFESDDTNTKGVSFVVEINEESFSITTNRILKVIKLNKEREQKEILFRNTIENLKKTFEQNDLDKLRDLYFDFATEIEDTSNLEQYESGESETIELAGESEEERPKRIRTTKKQNSSRIQKS